MESATAVAASRMKMITRSVKVCATFAFAASSFYAFGKFRKKLTLHAQNKNNWQSLLAQASYHDDASLPKSTVNSILRKQEFTAKMDRKNLGPIAWFETNHYNANNPTEDRHCECFFSQSNSYFFGIFDGHSGWHCAESLRLRLPLYLSLSFLTEKERNLYASYDLLPGNIVQYLGNPKDDCLSFQFPDNFSDKQKRLQTGSTAFARRVSDYIRRNSSISDLLKYTFLSLDRDIAKEAIPDGECNQPIWAGVSGAVAIGAYVTDKDLFVANTGDCRGVVGVKTSSGSWFDIPMSEDHTCDNTREVERIEGEHPNEKDTAIFNGRLLGQLQPLRSFGDVMYKWSKELHKEVLETIFGRPVVADNIYLTPPYLTCQPDVNHKTLEKDDRFLILACDGLWDTVSNEMAVKIVGQYLDDLQNGVKHEENASTKLIRYALARDDKHLLADMLQLPENVKRNYHDDISVTVIYFDTDFKYLKSKL